MFLKSILLRKGLRSDKIWGNPLFSREPFRRIPFYLDTYALNKSQYWPREELRKLGIERFAEIVKHASKIPFWKERFAKAGINPNTFRESDIARIPLLLKKDFLDKDVKEYTDSELLPKSQKYSTSGSTGKPLCFYRDQAYELRSPAVADRVFRTAGNGSRFPVIDIRRTANFRINDYMKYHFFYVPGYTSVRHRIREFEKFINLFPSEVILYGLSSTLLELARVCKELHLSFPLRCVLASGEELHDSQRMEIEEALQTEVRVHYGMREVRGPAFECSHHRLHLNEEVIYFEVTNDKGVPLPLGTKGHLLVTGFENCVMPFIRYDTGDLATINEDPCPCGRTLRTIEFQGRKVRLLHVGDGRTISLIEFFFVFDNYSSAIRQFQFVRIGECSFTIRIVPGSQFNKEKIEFKITEQLRMLIHPRVQVQWEVVDTIPEGPNGKALYFVDRFEAENHD